jgi:hypothetical protein
MIFMIFSVHSMCKHHNMKQIIAITFLLCTAQSFAQNVGIGTTTPQASLEVKKAVRSTVQISSNSYNDSSSLIFSNRNPSNQGTDFVLSSNQEQGLRISSQSDLAQNTNATIVNFTPAGNVGIAQAAPAERLDVNGNINVTGTIKTNGAAGTSGQVLTTAGNGTLSWGSVGSGFANFTAFNSVGGGQTWVVPAGVTKVWVEAWGGGGTGSIYYAASSGLPELYGNGGGGGGYISALANVTAASTLYVSVAAGAVADGGSPASAGTSAVLIGSTLIQAYGGGNASSAWGGGPGSGGTFNVSSPGTVVIGYDGLDGKYGENGYKTLFQSGTNTSFLNHYGNGGDAGNTTDTGGKGASEYSLGFVNPVVLRQSSRPGGGGPGRYSSFNTAGGYYNGAAGKVIIHW